MRLETQPIAYFVDSNNCWICYSHTDDGRHKYRKFGYPTCRFNGRKYRISHLMLMLKHKISKIDGFALHKCDNPLCINPDHLYIGTIKDNIRDKVERGRNSKIRGHNNHDSKLTEEQVIAIRNSKLNGSQLAKMYGVNRTSIYRILSGKHWGHIQQSTKRGDEE